MYIMYSDLPKYYSECLCHDVSHYCLFYLQPTNKSHGGATIHAFILEPGVVTSTTATVRRGEGSPTAIKIFIYKTMEDL
jgi:hypothetical protein